VAKQFYLRWLTVLTALLIAVNVPGQAQNSARQSASPKQALVDPVKLIQIDAVVTDKKGRFVAGLGPQNFALEEEGRPQSLIGVDHFVAGGVGDGQKPNQDPVLIDLTPDRDLLPNINPEMVRPVVINRRVIVLYFDMTSMTPEELKRSVNASEEFLKRQMAASDLAAVISLGNQFTINCELTNDRELLEHVVASLIPSEASQLMNLPGSPPETISRENGWPDEDQTEYHIFGADYRLYAVQVVAEIVGVIPGRKSVVQFSGSLSGFNVINPSALRTVINAENVNTVSLYEVDLCDSTGPSPREPVMEDPGDSAQFAAAMRSRKILESLAHETGGKLFTDVKDFAPIFKQVQDDSQDYYLLSYYSSNAKRDGLFRNVSVKSEKIRGTQIKFRPGYYAPKDVPNTNTQHR
jgi:VWFA-related protein